MEIDEEESEQSSEKRRQDHLQLQRVLRQEPSYECCQSQENQSLLSFVEVDRTRLSK